MTGETVCGGGYKVSMSSKHNAVAVYSGHFMSMFVNLHKVRMTFAAFAFMWEKNNSGAQSVYREMGMSETHYRLYEASLQTMDIHLMTKAAELKTQACAEIDARRDDIIAIGESILRNRRPASGRLKPNNWSPVR
ncbi:MAG: hypothetical protein CM1200mP18_15570 [Gammaproteobacteria bacterium]|nr:MAG: hypothetical protein CM1200mP18_15570 [Gammaproteobacteria bacterium]